MRPRRSMVVAMARNRAIGHGNGMPWHLPVDLQHFKRLTMGHPVIMGRKTHESIGKALPGRLNIIVTRNAKYTAPGCVVVTSLDDAWKAAGPADEIFVMGGGELYAAALPTCDRIYLTDVTDAIPGDTFFPELDPSQWMETVIGYHPRDERHSHELRFLQLDRI